MEQEEEGRRIKSMVVRRARKRAVSYLQQADQAMQAYKVHLGFDMMKEARSVLKRSTGPVETEDLIGRATRIRRDLVAMRRIITTRHQLMDNREYRHSLHT